jgi:hypothetical protein
LSTRRPLRGAALIPSRSRAKTLGLELLNVKAHLEHELATLSLSIGLRIRLLLRRAVIQLRSIIASDACVSTEARA